MKALLVIMLLVSMPVFIWEIPSRVSWDVSGEVCMYDHGVEACPLFFSIEHPMSLRSNDDVGLKFYESSTGQRMVWTGLPMFWRGSLVITARMFGTGDGFDLKAMMCSDGGLDVLVTITPTSPMRDRVIPIPGKYLCGAFTLVVKDRIQGVAGVSLLIDRAVLRAMACGGWQ